MLQWLSIETRTLHAELMERLTVREAQRNIGTLPGTFTTKRINGADYVYFLHNDPGGIRRNICVGRQSPLIEQLKEQHKSGRREESEDPIGIRELSQQLKAGRVSTADHALARIIRELADGGVFNAGGVLVGTQAFACIGNILGVIWDRTTLGTQDIDIAAEKNVSVAVPNIAADIPKILESLTMGFFPVPTLNRKHPSTSFSIRKSPIRVDMLTPMIRGNTEPVMISRFNAAAFPLRFLDYLIEDSIPGAVINGDAIAVRIPQPIRYALHKLIVSQERDVTAGAKKHKDLWQAHQILDFFKSERPLDIQPAWEELVAHGTDWQKKALRGYKEMECTFGRIDILLNEHPKEFW